MSNVIKNRHEIVFFIQAKNCNPNGDPDYENRPRIDYDTQKAIITDVAIKRKIRDYIATRCGKAEGYDIFVKESTNLNRAIAECNMKANEGTMKRDENSEKAADIAKQTFFDVRTFGGVLSTGANAGQIQGCVQVEMANSIDKVNQQKITITRVAYTADDKKFSSLEDYDNEWENREDATKRTMGKKTFVPYGLFECHMYVSANIAQQNNFTEDDLNLLLESIMNMYEYQSSASKAGMSVIGPVIIFKHIGTQHENNEKQNENESLLGCVAAHKLFKLIDVHKKDDVKFPRDFTDYEATISTSKLHKGVQVGFKYNPFDDIVWNHLSEDDEWFKEL